MDIFIYFVSLHTQNNPAKYHKIIKVWSNPRILVPSLKGYFHRKK